jgi:hypothetical protein
MFSDSLDELHVFASRIGLRRAWFQNHAKLPHYDLTERRRKAAVALGANEVGRRFVYDFMNKKTDLSG